MNWYKKAQITTNEFGEHKFKWPKGWNCSVKKNIESGLYWATLKFDGNRVIELEGDYPSQARMNAFKWLEWYLKNGKQQLDKYYQTKPI